MPTTCPAFPKTLPFSITKQCLVEQTSPRIHHKCCRDQPSKPKKIVIKLAIELKRDMMEEPKYGKGEKDIDFSVLPPSYARFPSSRFRKRRISGYSGHHPATRQLFFSESLPEQGCQGGSEHTLLPQSWVVPTRGGNSCILNGRNALYVNTLFET